jgi:hypothetical protein
MRPHQKLDPDLKSHVHTLQLYQNELIDDQHVGLNARRTLELKPCVHTLEFDSLARNIKPLLWHGSDYMQHNMGNQT